MRMTPARASRPGVPLRASRARIAVSLPPMEWPASSQGWCGCVGAESADGLGDAVGHLADGVAGDGGGVAEAGEVAMAAGWRPRRVSNGASSSPGVGAAAEPMEQDDERAMSAMCLCGEETGIRWSDAGFAVLQGGGEFALRCGGRKQSFVGRDSSGGISRWESARLGA